MRHEAWRESAYYSFSQQEIDELKVATTEVHMLALQAVQSVIQSELYAELGIPSEWIPMIEQSWKNRDGYVLGRLDFGYDGTSVPKLIEYDADASRLLIEAGAIQVDWADGKPQFSNLMDELPKRWEDILGSQHLHVTCDIADEEALSSAIFMREMAIKGGCTTTDIAINDIGWNRNQRVFQDLDNAKIERLYKLYPWTWMLKESFGSYLLNSPAQMIEPAWKIILESKGILAVLWKLFPNHPNLLPASRKQIEVGRDCVKKPFFGREGNNITVELGSKHEQTGGRVESKEFVFQGIAPIPTFGIYRPVVSSFVVGDKPAAIGVVEDGDMITSNSAVFVPHLIDEKA